VHFDAKASWYPALLEEMIRFDRGTYDDQVDALAWIGLTLDEMLPGKQQEEIEEEEYLDMIEEAGVGRSPDGGY